MTRKQAEQISQDMYQLEALEAFLSNLKLLIEDIAPRHYAYIRLERCTVTPGMENQVLIEEKEVLEAIYTAKSAQREMVVERLTQAGVEL